MISTRNVYNPQSEALGKVSRYEQPVSSFTRSAMPSVSDLIDHRKPPPTQSTPTRQPLEAPSTLSAIAAGVSGNNADPVAPSMPAYTPDTELRSFLDDYSTDTATGMMKDRLVSGVVKGMVASVMGADPSQAFQVVGRGVVPGPISLLSMADTGFTTGVAKDSLTDLYDEVLSDVPREKLEAYARVGNEKIGKAHADDWGYEFDVEDPTEVFQPEEMGQYMATNSMLDQHDEMTGIGMGFQGLQALLEETPLKEETLQFWDTPEIPEPVLDTFKSIDPQFALTQEERSFWDRMVEQDPSNAQAMLHTPSAQEHIDRVTSNIDPMFKDWSDAWDSTFGDVFGGSTGGGSGDGPTGGDFDGPNDSSDDSPGESRY